MYNQIITLLFEHFQESGNVNGVSIHLTKHIHKTCARQIYRLANWRLKGHNCTSDLKLGVNKQVNSFVVYFHSKAILWHSDFMKIKK